MSELAYVKYLEQKEKTIFDSRVANNEPDIEKVYWLLMDRVENLDQAQREFIRGHSESYNAIYENMLNTSIGELRKPELVLLHCLLGVFLNSYYESALHIN